MAGADISTQPRRAASLARVTLYALVATRASIAVDLFRSKHEAEAALARITRSEPYLADRLRVIRVNFEGGLPTTSTQKPPLN